MKARVCFGSFAVAALVVTGCSNGSSGGGDNTAATTPPVTESPSASASESPSESATPTPTPSFSSTVSASKRCLTTHLQLSLGQGQGAAGSALVPIVFTNTGSHACTLYGYPGVSFLDASGNQLGAAATHQGGEQAVVTLAPEGTAHSVLQMPEPENFDPGSCKVATSAQLRVYPPGDFKALTIAYSTSVCTSKQGWSSVSSVTPGSGG